MDLDPTRVMRPEEHIDEDLIEYDLGTDAMDGANQEWAAEDLEIQDVDDSHTDRDMDSHIHMENLPDDMAGQHPEAMDTLDVLPFSSVTVHDADMLSDLGHDESLQPQDVEELHVDAVEEAPVVEVTASSHDTFDEEAPETNIGEEPAEEIEEVEEIDFGTVDEEVADAAPSSVVDAVAAENSEAIKDLVNETDQEHLTNQVAPKAQGKIPAEEEEELTWEEEDDAQKEPAELLQTAAKEQTTQRTEGEPEVAALSPQPGHEDDGDPGEVHSTSAVTHATTPDKAIAQAIQEEEKVTKEEQHARENEREAVPEAIEKEVTYPSITVQYKGEEFPCFATSDGFFTNTTVLEESIERLLAGFRAELAAELAPDEELVFHIDELGLEFAESTQQDILAGTTLQYVLEIYDMLVQNQDQDQESGSKTLYTYLFTRSSTSKRLEFLAESAANGKGLDEVIHLFEPAMVQHNIDNSPDDTPALLDEQGDDYPSPGDELPEGGEYNEEDPNDKRQEVEHADQPQLAEGVVVNSVLESEDIGTTSFAAESLLAQDASSYGQAGETGAADTDKPPSPENKLDPRDDVAEAPNNPHTADPNSLDGYGELSEHIDGNPQSIEARIAATSSSSTVDGNEIDPLNAIEESVDGVAADDADEPATEGEDALVEIDWREEGDEVTEDAPADDQTTPAKRARADDDLGSGEENDAKRQRSS